MFSEILEEVGSLDASVGLNSDLSNLQFSLRHQFSSVQSLSRVRLFVTPWTSALEASLSITNSRSHTNPCPWSRWCHPTISSSVVPFSPCPQSFPASGSFQMSQLFASGGQSIGVSVFLNVSPTAEHPGLISFRMDWLDLLAVQGTLKSLLQPHSSKASILLRMESYNHLQKMVNEENISCYIF